MARPNPGHCVHCGRYSDHLTWDHVLPLSWYPECTPAELEKWKIPACEECNRSLGVLEKELLVRFGLCFGPEDALAAGIGQKALRSVKPEFASNEEDRKHRQALREKIQSELLDLNPLPETGVMPYFGPRPDLHYDEYVGIRIPEQDLHRLGQKMVRGITYLEERVVLGPEYRVDTYITKEGPVGSLEEMFESHGRLSHRGPGFVVVRARTADDPITSIVRIVIWGRLRLHGVVYHERLESEVEAQRKRPAT